MADKSKIAWTEATWNVVVGCSKVSPGCLNCYAEKMAHRLACIPSTRWRYNGLIDYEKGGYRWNGSVSCIESALTKPLHWRNPRKIFVCSMGDLFHESVPFEFIDKVFAVMALCPQHDFQVLTKRHERRLEYIKGKCQARRIVQSVAVDTVGCKTPGIWPLPNAWQLSTICNQPEADKYIPVLLDTPAALHGISVEPMLGPVSLRWLAAFPENGRMMATKPRPSSTDDLDGLRELGWVIIGCESGKNRRRCDPQWMIDLVRQCKAAGVPCFVKQVDVDGKALGIKDMARWPKELQNIQEMPK